MVPGVSVRELAKRKRGVFVESEYVSDRMKIIGVKLAADTVDMIEKGTSSQIKQTA